MATVSKIKKSETSGSAPTTSDLVAGEVALNTADKIAYVRDSSNQIIKFANYTDADESLTFPTGDWGSVASSLSTDAFGQLVDKEYDMNTTIKYRLATEDMGSDSSI